MKSYWGPLKLVLFDVDGVLTDGSLYIGESGETFKQFNVRDGLAIALLRAHGIRTGIISGKTSAALNERIRQLKFDVAITGRLEKLAAYQEIKLGDCLVDSEIAFVGDDVVDLPLAGVVGYFFAPSDAHPLVIGKADRVVSSAGGRGVAREVAEEILQMGGLTLDEMYEPLTNQWNSSDITQ